MENKYKWYVIRVIGGQEIKIKNYIENEVKKNNMEDLVEKVLVPTERVYSIKNGKKTSKDKVSFPGYIVLNIGLEGEVSHIIKSVPGVVGFLSEKKGGDPVPMRDSEVRKMLGDIDEKENSDEEVFDMEFSKGEFIKVTEGAFNGFDGVIENVDTDRMKLEVVVKIFGRKTPMELGFNQVEKIV